ncbi:MAG: DUF4115 domain-containing protein [Sneathiella sp.]|nr:DUF4115 domain-containing protein [Sneathiella sp.]
MSKQGKLPLNKDEARLKLGIDNSTDEATETPIHKDAEKPSELVQNTDTPEAENSSNEMLEPQFTSAEELGQQDHNIPHTLGENLRDERERQGLTLHDVAEQLRLRPKQIEALENGDYDSLPGHTFVAGFLRSYANLLRLDAIAIVELYRSESQVGTQPAELAFPEPTSEGRIPGSGLILAALLLVAALFAGWYFYLEENRLELEQVANLPEELLNKIGGEEQALPTEEETVTSDTSSVAEVAKPELVENVSTSDETQSVVASADTQPDADLSSEDSATVSAQPEPVVMEEAPDVAVSAAKILEAKEEVFAEKTEAPATVAPESEVASVVDAPEPVEVAEVPVNQPSEPVVTASEPQPASQINEQTPEYPQSTLTAPENADAVADTAPVRGADLGVENADSRVVLVAVQETWVQVADQSGEVLFDSVLGAGDSYMLPNRDDLQLSAANAGGLEVRLDGQSIGMLGLNGVIVQSMPVTDETLREKIRTSE